MLTFSVPGEPIPKGSAKAFVIKTTGRPVVTHDNKRTRSWEAMVSHVACEAMKFSAHAGSLFEGALLVHMNFFLPRPPSVSTKRRPHPITRPDLDKLARAVLDAMSTVVFVDDSQVCSLFVLKSYADDRLPGLEVQVSHL